MATNRTKPIVTVTDREIIAAVDWANGSYKLAADKLRIAYSTIIRRAKHNPEIVRAKYDACADFCAIAEDVVYNEVLDGNFTAAKFVLERLSREKWGNHQVPQTTEASPSPIGDAPVDNDDDDEDTYLNYDDEDTNEDLDEEVDENA